MIAGSTTIAIDNIIVESSQNLKHSLDTFQKGTDRDVICLFEFASSGTFCDDLIDSNTLPYSRTIITCTDEGYSYLDQTGLQSFTGQLFTLIQDSNQINPGLFEDTGISFYDRVRLLQGLFSKSRETFWAQGHPFSTQPPQMVTSQGPHTLYKITLSPDPILSTIPNPNIPTITDPSQTVFLNVTGHYLDGNIPLDSTHIHYHSSDPFILLVNSQGEAYANPNTNYNGTAYILGTIIDPNFTQAPVYDLNFTQSPALSPDSCSDPNHPCLGGVTGHIPIKVKIPIRKEKEDRPKAIIVAGRCENEAGYDYLWESIKLIANQAYDTFIERGYSPDNIYYLSHDPNHTGVDGPPQGEGFSDILEEIFTNPNNPYLDLKGLTDLTIFLVDHGKEDQFMLDNEEYLSPMMLDLWLDEYPNAKITIIVEACHSGCFVGSLTDGTQNRIVITSARDTTSYIESNTSISFSFFLFNYLKSGATLADAFEGAHININSMRWGGVQTPVLEDNQDRHFASSTRLGGSFIISQAQPQITQTSEFNDPNYPVFLHEPIPLWAEVSDLETAPSDLDVWATISESQISRHYTGATDDPLVGLPKVVLSYNPETRRYDGTYEGFSSVGPYTIMFLARDAQGMVSYPKTVHLTIEGEHQERAILVYDLGLNFYVEFAQKVLEKRRIPPECINILQCPEALFFALDQIIASPPEKLERLLIYYICQGDLSGLDLDTLSHKLDKIQDDTNCTSILLVDAHFSGALLLQFSGQNRIIITSTDTSHPAHTPRFSHFFFSSIYNGVNIDKAFRFARHAIKCFSLQSPLLDDNADGKYTESGDNEDGRMAKSVYIGSPFQQVPSGPTITTPSVVHIRGWETNTYTIWAEVRDPNSLVRAHIRPPEGDPNWVSLSYDPDKGRFEADYPGFTQPGIYIVTIYAQDREGLLDFDQSRYIMLIPDAYEPDDTPVQACPIAVNDQAQYHSFHDPNDSDWVYFYAYPNRGYTISALMRDEGYHALIRIYDSERNLIDYASATTIFSTRQNGYYLLRVSYPYSSLPNVYPDYDLSVVYSYALNSGGLYGSVKDKDTGKGITGAGVCVISDPYSIDGNYPCRICTDEWWSNDPKDSIGYMEEGFFFFPLGLLTEGIHRISAQARGYTSEACDIRIEKNSFIEKTFYLERVDPDIPSPDIDPNVMLMTVGEIALNREKVKGLKVTLYPGLNLFSYPLEYPSYYYAKEFLSTHDPYHGTNGPQWFSGIRCYDKNKGQENTCYFTLSNQNTWSIESSDPNNPLGFPIRYKEGYTLYVNQGKTLSFAFPPPNPPIILKEGTNWIGIPSPPPGYTSHIMLKEIGTPEEVVGISGYDPLAEQGHNPLTGQWESTYWEFGKPGGKNFPIISGQGYIVFMLKEKDWLPGEGF